jgi:hypothetical protein
MRLRPDQERAHSASLHLVYFALIVAVPLLLLVGALLWRSVALEREQLERRVLQVQDALVAALERDFDRQFTTPHSLHRCCATVEVAMADALRGLLWGVLMLGAAFLLVEFVAAGSDTTYQIEPTEAFVPRDAASAITSSCPVRIWPQFTLAAEAQVISDSGEVTVGGATYRL